MKDVRLGISNRCCRFNPYIGPLMEDMMSKSDWELCKDGFWLLIVLAVLSLLLAWFYPFAEAAPAPLPRRDAEWKPDGVWFVTSPSGQTYRYELLDNGMFRQQSAVGNEITAVKTWYHKRNPEYIMLRWSGIGVYTYLELYRKPNGEWVSDGGWWMVPQRRR